ncbi:hypothetical protein GCM10028807_47060 [Spirosoma daeguense]
MKPSFSLLSTLFCLILVLAISCKKDPAPTPGSGTTTTKSSAKAITGFAFSTLTPAVTGAISGNTISATVASGTDVTKLVPTITASDKATVSPASGVAQDFSKAVTYTVTAEDGTTQAYTATVIKAATNTNVSSGCILATLRYEDMLGSGGTKRQWDITFDHDATKRLTKRVIKSSDDPGIETTTYSYDADGFLTQIDQVLSGASSAVSNFTRKVSYAYQNARLVQKTDDLKYPSQPASNTLETTSYEYESATGLDLSKKTVQYVGIGSGFTRTLTFKDGVLTKYAVNNLGPYVVNDKGQVVGYSTTYDKYTAKYTFDADGQLAGYQATNAAGVLTSDKTYQYSTIPNRYYGPSALVDKGSVTTYFGTPDAVVNPLGFKGFPPLDKAGTAAYTGPGAQSKYVQTGQDDTTYFTNGTSEKITSRASIKTNANGLISSYVWTYSNRPNDTFTYTYTYANCQ